MSQKYKYTVEVNCTYCNKVRTRIVANLSSAVERVHKGNNFCSAECRMLWSKENRKTKLCPVCNSLMASHRKFCSNTCYWKDKSVNKEKYGSVEKANRARTFKTDQTYPKAMQTKFERGSIVDWENKVEWKQYYRKCDDLVRKIKAKAKESWDGCDFYDGEFIANNFSLDPRDSNYPSLDHKIPRNEGFRLGLSPHQITQIGNLVWTKRRLNSQKNGKTDGVFAKRILEDLRPEAIEFNLFLQNFNGNIKCDKVNIEEYWNRKNLIKEKRNKEGDERRRISHIKAVNQISIETNEILRTFESVKQAEDEMTKNQIKLPKYKRNISNTILGNQKTAYGYFWELTNK